MEQTKHYGSSDRVSVYSMIIRSGFKLDIDVNHSDIRKLCEIIFNVELKPTKNYKDFCISLIQAVMQENRLGLDRDAHNSLFGIATARVLNEYFSDSLK